jgi:hypothetical protein
VCLCDIFTSTLRTPSCAIDLRRVSERCNEAYSRVEALWFAEDYFEELCRHFAAGSTAVEAFALVRDFSIEE